MTPYLPDLDLQTMLQHLVDLALAFVLALPVGWDRERSNRSLGLRTFPLVSLASCGFVLLAADAMGDDSQALARVLQGIITGVGFLGGGAIVKSGFEVHGVSTAASIWLTAGIGATVALDRWEIALVLSFANFAILRWLGAVGDKISENDADDTRPDDDASDQDDRG